MHRLPPQNDAASSETPAPGTAPSAWKEWLGIELNVVSAREKGVATLGGLLAIFLLIYLSEQTMGLPHATSMVASMGASAVLIFAVPHGQLSQPWPVLAGHVLSALIGVTCAKTIPHSALAAACAVGLSIGLMHQLKCIHPPEGATALTAVLGGPAIHELGYRYALCPVLLNATAILVIGVLYNLPFPWRRYPASLVKRPAAPMTPTPPSHTEVIHALRSLDSFVDITEDDLLQLLTQLQQKRHNPSSPPSTPPPQPS